MIPLKPINFEATARAVEQYAEQHNIPAPTFPTAQGRGAETVAPVPEVSSKSHVMKRLPMIGPEYVIDSLKERAARDKGASVRCAVLSALKAYGIEVDDDDMVKDKRQ